MQKDDYLSIVFIAFGMIFFSVAFGFSISFCLFIVLSIPLIGETIYESIANLFNSLIFLIFGESSESSGGFIYAFAAFAAVCLISVFLFYIINKYFDKLNSSNSRIINFTFAFIFVFVFLPMFLLGIILGYWSTIVLFG